MSTKYFVESGNTVKSETLLLIQLSEGTNQVSIVTQSGTYYIDFTSPEESIRGYSYLKYLLSNSKVLITDPDKLLQGYDEVAGSVVPLNSSTGLSGWSTLNE